MYSFPDLEPVCCSISSSNCCFLTCIQISQKAGQVVWYSHLLKNFSQFIVVHTDKGFGIVNKAEIDVFLELSCFATWSLVPLPFLKPTWTYGSSRFTYCWSLAWRILSITLLACAAAAAAKSLQSCPTLCDPRDSSPPGSPIPGILQARTLEWLAISFSNAWKWKVKVKSLRDECNSAVVWASFGIAFLWDWNENWPFPVL